MAPVSQSVGCQPHPFRGIVPAVTSRTGGRGSNDMIGLLRVFAPLLAGHESLAEQTGECSEPAVCSLDFHQICCDWRLSRLILVRCAVCAWTVSTHGVVCVCWDDGFDSQSVSLSLSSMSQVGRGPGFLLRGSPAQSAEPNGRGQSGAGTRRQLPSVGRS